MQSEKQAYAVSRCKNKGEVVAICCSRGWAMQFPCVYEKSRLEIPMGSIYFYLQRTVRRSMQDEAYGCLVG